MKEQYKIVNNKRIIKFDYFVLNLDDKNKNSYGVESARIMRDRIINVFEGALNLLDTNNEHNLLLIGKVQSGKTSNLELFTAFAFDNGYDIMIIFGGYDNTLVDQTNNRLKSTFDISDDALITEPSPILICSNNKGLSQLTSDNIDNYLDKHKKIIINIIKNKNAIESVTNILKGCSKKYKAFIIDDEGDQASLNTSKDKINKMSATYGSIVKLKDTLNNPLYMISTATPQANVLLNNYSRLLPQKLNLLPSGKGYCGASAFHMGDPEKVVLIPNDELNYEISQMQPSLKKAIRYFVIAASIDRLRKNKSGIKENKAQMIIHNDVKIETHIQLYQLVDSVFKNEFKPAATNGGLERETLCKEFKKTYDEILDEEIKSKFPFNDELKGNLQYVISFTYITQKNSSNNFDPDEKRYPYVIYIGGNLLQRGVTFKELMVTYFSRWAKSGNMDTTLQRARRFGYREKFFDLCKVFTYEQIADGFSNLADVEEDLWEQFEEIENGDKKLEDIVIINNNENLKPTRGNVAKYKNVDFVKRWNKQRIGIFDDNILYKNNNLINKFINNHKFTSTNVGRKDDKPSASYCYIAKNDIIDLINSIDMIFESNEFNKVELLEKISTFDSIPVILFDRGDRKRTFNSDNKVNNVHQGQDNSDEEKMNYEGDVKVLIDKNKINIQILSIIPKVNGKIYESKKQYMFAVFSPTVKKGYIRG